MKKIILSFAILVAITTKVNAQQQLPNNGFESWTDALPTNYYDNKKGNSTAQLGPSTASKSTDAHSGSFSVLVETKDFVLAKVNGNLTSGYVNAPSTNKAEGYIGTNEHGNSNNVRRIDFTSRPDSLVGWFKYTPANDADEKGKVNVVLHKGHFYDPETPVNGNHDNLSANRIGTATFITENQTYSSWTRFSVPFTYVSSDNPEYILFTVTSSNNQMTNKAGSKLWIDDIELIYKEASVKQISAETFHVFNKDNEVIVDFTNVKTADAEISILDMAGKKVASSKLNANTINSFVIPQVTTGVYLYQITGNGINKTGKLMF